VHANWAEDRDVMKDAVRYLVNKARGLRDAGYARRASGAVSGGGVRCLWWIGQVCVPRQRP
jgi:hypothetical protein